VGQVGLALGIASLTVEEQATTFATLANNGQYVTPHVIAQITDNGNHVPLKITRRQVLTAAQAADVNYALSADTSPGGTAYPNGVLNPQRPTIGKTGTTDNSQSAFFIGAIPQYSLAVGIFTNHQTGSKTDKQSLTGLASVNGQGGGFGGNWPTTIWQTYMQNEFANLQIAQFGTLNTAGFVKWVQVPKQHHKPKKHQDQNPNPNPGPSCGPGRHHHGQPCPAPGPTGGPSPAPSSTGSPTPTPSASAPTPGATAGALQSTNVTAAVLLLAAEEPTTASVRRPRGG
jgi:membrane peptidoglycan carboxypeptidase